MDELKISKNGTCNVHNPNRPLNFRFLRRSCARDKPKRNELFGLALTMQRTNSWLRAKNHQRPAMGSSGRPQFLINYMINYMQKHNIKAGFSKEKPALCLSFLSALCRRFAHDVQLVGGDRFFQRIQALPSGPAGRSPAAAPSALSRRMAGISWLSITVFMWVLVRLALLDLGGHPRFTLVNPLVV